MNKTKKNEMKERKKKFTVIGLFHLKTCLVFSLPLYTVKEMNGGTKITNIRINEQ